jgi:hypothetical protein
MRQRPTVIDNPSSFSRDEFFQMLNVKNVKTDGDKKVLQKPGLLFKVWGGVTPGESSSR